MSPPRSVSYSQPVPENSPNQLFYGDNLDVLRRYVADESVDLVYLDPPFNSNANYNVLFAERDGTQATAQIKAFEDTWHWDKNAARSYQDVVEHGEVSPRRCRRFGHSSVSQTCSPISP